MAQSAIDYPVRFSVEYPDRPQDRFTVLFRLVFLIPIVIVISALGAGAQYTAPMLMILFRRKYPRWWFDWALELARFTTRVEAYLLLLTDEYPSTDEEQSVHLEIPYPNVETDLNRWLPLVKWLLAVPHWAVLAVLAVVAIFVLVLAWFAILFTGRYPRGLFDFTVGVLRWDSRVWAYSILLSTDRYPPFRLGA